MTPTDHLSARFFKSPAEFRRWLHRNHDKVSVLWVGFHKRSSGKPSLTWPEAVNAALSFGWIDGVRRSVDESRYANRFTPRKKGSNWSAINIAKVRALRRAGLMHPAGLAAFKDRSPERSGTYSYEQQKQGLSPDYQTRFKSNGPAWLFYRAQTPWYQRITARWVMSAKKEETRLKRLATLIEDCALGRLVKELRRPEQPA